MAAPIPCDAERVQALGQRRDGPAAGRASEDLPVEHARHEDGRSVGGHAFDEAMLWWHRENDLRRGDNSSGCDRQRDHRSAPATSFWSLLWMLDEPAMY